MVIIIMMIIIIIIIIRGRGNSIPCNWKEIYRGYKLSATCIQHYKST